MRITLFNSKLHAKQKTPLLEKMTTGVLANQKFNSAAIGATPFNATGLLK